ncbi:MAG: MarR family transcriptional regulator [Desulfobacteraceae bacterium]
MENKRILDQAKLVFTTGKMIRERVFSKHLFKADSRNREKPFQDLTMPQFHVLMLIQHRGKVSVKELARSLLVTPPSASVMVEKLVDKKLLVRTPCLEDRRKVDISLSSEAARKIDEIESITLSAFVELVEELGPETTEKWCEVLEQIQTILKKESTFLP